MLFIDLGHSSFSAAVVTFIQVSAVSSDCQNDHTPDPDYSLSGGETRFSYLVEVNQMYCEATEPERSIF